MKRLLLSTLICLATLSTVSGKNASLETTRVTLAQAYGQAKSDQEKLTPKSSLPVSCGPVKSKQDAVGIVADVTGLRQIVLVAWGGNGGESDRAVWGNARLTTADGKTVWLDELKESFGKDGFGAVRVNLNTKNNSPKIGEVTYEHAVMTPMTSEVVVPLGKKYVKFEAAVGVQEIYSGGANVTFRVQAGTGREAADEFVAAFPMALSTSISHYSTNTLRLALTAPDSDSESAAARGMVARLGKDNRSYFDSRLEEAGLVADLGSRVEAYISIAEQAFEVYTLGSSVEWINMRAITDAYNDMSKSKSFDTKTYGPKLDELKALVAKGFDGIYSYDKDAMAAAERAVELKREILLANPALDVDKIIVGRYDLGTRARSSWAYDLGTQNNNWSNQTTSRRSGFKASIEELSGIRGATPMSRTIFKPTNGSSVPDLTLHWNADRIMFSMVDSTKKWQVYQVGVDGGDFKQVTNVDEPDLDFFDGTYLPDGRMLVVSNLGYHGVPCVNGSDEVGNMCVYDPKTGDLRRITFDQDANWGPVVMNNGRVMYTRWEYTDLVHYFSRFVMHMNPDGTEQKALFGSGEWFPNSTFDIKPLPGSTSRFIGVISGHHGVARSGRLIIFDPSKARKGVAGMVQELPYRDREIIPVVKDYLVNNVWPQFIKPYPINDEYFLVSAKLDPNGLWGIYLIDVFDNLTLVAEYEGEGLIHPIIAEKRPTPPTIPDRIVPGDKQATVFIQDIYEGEGLDGIPRGTVKSLRVYAYEYAYIKSPSDHVAMGIQSGWDIKRLLGTVPVEEDGSIVFKIPANTPISLQPLDGNGHAVQWMRSWLTGQPGEVVSCTGCHEDQNSIPAPKRVLASRKSAGEIIKPKGGVRSITFEHEIQPVLDQACVSCHNEEHKLDYTGGKIDKIGRGYSTSYLNLHPYVRRQGAEAEIEVMNIYEYHVNTSALYVLLKNGHYGVSLTDEQWQALTMWIDMNAPEKGSFTATTQKGFNQIERRIELMNKYAGGMGVDWQQEVRDYADFLASQPAVAPAKADFTPGRYNDVKVKGWPFDSSTAQAMQRKAGKERKVVEVAPGIKMTFVWIPAGSFVMGKNGDNSDFAPASKQTIRKGFWMSEKEVSNRQFRAISTRHNSGKIAQQWKDHVGPGYEADLDEQPAIRMSWEQAMEYCRIVGQKSGLKVTLPTEAQWEWACRAGSETDFWYGDLHADFGAMENMADTQLNKLAVSGVDPKPMSPNNGWYKYFSFHPKENSVDDGNMLMVEGGSYLANPWGLYDMHGNVAEWTRSDYLPYPYSEKKAKHAVQEKVARGGSWKDHPKLATAQYRRHYLPWQRVHNVGMRVIIEE